MRLSQQLFEAMASGVTSYNVPSPTKQGGIAQRAPKSEYADAIIPVTLRVTSRGRPVPKRRPVWISDLRGKTDKSQLRHHEKTSRFRGDSVGEVVSPAGLSKMLGYAEKMMVSQARGEPRYLVQVVVSAKIPQGMTRFPSFRSGGNEVLAVWDAWSKKWKLDDRSGAQFLKILSGNY